MSNIEHFISMVTPIPREGEYLNLHWRDTIRKNNRGQPQWSGRATLSSKEFERAVTYFQQGKDCFVCMSLQTRTKQVTGRMGQPILLPERARSHATWLRSLYIDIDVKPGAYATTQDAMVALKQMCVRMNMPTPSCIVSSGTGGLHVYWSLDQDLTVLEWQPLANALANAAAQVGLKFDSACTVDAARILRVPDTFNHKTDPPSPVKLLGIGARIPLNVMKGVLEPYISSAPAFTTGTEMVSVLAPRGVTSDNDELSGGITSTGNELKFTIQEVAGTCPFIRKQLETGGADFKEPQWALTAGMMPFVLEPENAFHALSSGHVEYDFDQAQQKLDAALHKQAEHNFGWPQCETINRSGLSYANNPCATCPHLAKGKSPFNFVARNTPVPKVSTGPSTCIPDGYDQDAEGRFHKYTTRDDGSQDIQRVTPYPMIDGWLQVDPWTLHFTTKIGAFTKPVAVELAECNTRDAAMKAFAANGMVMSDNEGKRLKEFIVAWVQKLQHSKDRIRSSTAFGWTLTAKREIEGFSFDGKVWMQGDERPAASVDPVLARQYEPCGDIQVWVDSCRMITEQKRPELDVIIAASFGAPLVEFTGERGSIISAYSKESGIGKSTTLKVAQAVWGHPVRAMQSLDDTINSVLGKLGKTNSLPLFWDELKTEEQTKKFVQLAFSLSGGKEKSRMKQDTTMREVGEWKTLLMSASNDSIMDAMMRGTKGTVAGSMRCLEYAVRPPSGPSPYSTGEMSRKIAELERNHGGVGLVYAKYLGENHVAMRAAVAAEYDRLYRAHSGTNEERLWFVAIACSLMGAHYANQLGYAQFDIPMLESFLTQVLQDNRDEMRRSPGDITNDLSVANILTQYMKATRARHTVVTNRIHVGKGRPVAGAVKTIGDYRLLDTVNVQIGQDDGIVRIARTAFNKWLMDHGYPTHTFAKQLEEKYHVKFINGRIASGTEYAGGTEYLIEIDTNDPSLKGLIDRGDEEASESDDE